MAVEVPFSLTFDGGDAERHELPAYDGYTALAGFSLSLALVTNYVETGRIRRRGDFTGRSAVKTHPLESGSVISLFTVELAEVAVLTAGAAAVASREFLYDIYKRTVDRNLGIEPRPDTDELRILERTRGGDLEALVAATEPSIRQAHSVIGDGAQVMNILGGRHQIGSFTPTTKAYVDGTMRDDTIRQKDVSVASFNVNSGYGGVFDDDLGRVVPIKLTKDTLARAKSVLSWGLDQYANATGKRITLRYMTWLSLDGTVKKYIVVDAEIPPQD